MEERVLGGTGLTVSALGLGGAGIGGLYRAFESDDEAAQVVRAAFEAGISYVDTAPLYGKGASERRIGLALRGHPLRERITVATKLGYVPEGYDFSFDATLRSVESSLKRLGLERLPLVQIHELREETWDAVMAPRGALAALRRLQGEGAVGWAGATSSHEPTLRRILEQAPRAFDTLFVWRHFNLLDPRLGQEIIPRAAGLGLGIVVGTPFAGGLLASGSDPQGAGPKYFYRDAPEEMVARTREIEARCAAHGVPLGAVALRFCLEGVTRPSPQENGVAVVVAGADSVEQVRANVALMDVPVPASLMAEVREWATAPR
jgi:D-threo-aldose 1-dehydrogenase